MRPVLVLGGVSRLSGEAVVRIVAEKPGSSIEARLFESFRSILLRRSSPQWCGTSENCRSRSVLCSRSSKTPQDLEFSVQQALGLGPQPILAALEQAWARLSKICEQLKARASCFTAVSRQDINISRGNKYLEAASRPFSMPVLGSGVLSDGP